MTGLKEQWVNWNYGTDSSSPVFAKAPVILFLNGFFSIRNCQQWMAERNIEGEGQLAICQIWVY